MGGVRMLVQTSDLPPSLAYARLLRETHRLIAGGQGDGNEADTIADRMDAPWHAMTGREQSRMRGLSVDLYSIAEGPKQIDVTAEELATWRRHFGEAHERVQVGDVDALLEFLRKPVPLEIPHHFIRF